TAAKCSKTNGSLTAPDLELQAASATGGRFEAYVEVRYLHNQASPGLIAGEQIGYVVERPYLVHGMGAGCGATADVEARVLQAERYFGGGALDYSGTGESQRAGS